jgi:ankyrin repeat protein
MSARCGACWARDSMRERLCAASCRSTGCSRCTRAPSASPTAFARCSTPARLRARVSLRSAFTPLEDATLLHVAAEFQCERALRALLGVGLEVDARAGLDAHGLGGHSALFHTVNSNANRAGPLMQLLLDAGARVDTRVAGLVWGRGFEWETACFDLTPIAFAQLGCLPQMHRDERQIADNVRRLLAAAERDPAAVRNVPNRYLAR